jgi:glucosylglycerate phosphorylase
VDPKSRIRRHLNILYGEQQSEQVWEKLTSILDSFHNKHPNLNKASPITELLSERDVILITYGDQVKHPEEAPFHTLNNFLDNYIKDLVSGVHLLPFYPSSSDDGFSVIDYRKVDPALGDWEGIERIGQKYKLMFDAVINHISQHSSWFKAFLEGEKPYADYFVTTEPEADLQSVVRPRTHPLLTPFETGQGELHVWTTFSSDQIDLNYKNPQVLLEIVDLLLFYVERGADFLRLDAIAYLWKEIGTSSIHLPQTHAVVKLFRAVLDVVAPDVILITETNVPHEENISYYGERLPGSDRTDEAQMVYQFPLAPLTAHTFISASSQRLREWAEKLDTSQPFFNFIASHDGIGMMPVRGLLKDEEIQKIIDRTLEHGGQVSYKKNQDGSLSVYELNITLFDLLNDPESLDIDINVSRFLASQALMLSLSGVPGIYFHSLFGSRNCLTCFEETGRARSINREKVNLETLEYELADPDSCRSRVFKGYRRMLQVRKEQIAFHPKGDQRILDIGDGLFGVLRISPDEEEKVLCIISVTAQHWIFPKSALHKERLHFRYYFDLLTGQTTADPEDIKVGAYQVLWLKLG